MAETYSTKKENKAEKVMTFWDHLNELRLHIMRSIIAVVFLAIIAFYNREFIFDQVILAPSDSNFITYRALCWLSHQLSIESLCIPPLELQIININMSGQFMTHMYISAVAGFLLAFPYILWEIWQFVKPAMKAKEQKYSRGGVLISSILFLIGVLFSFYVIVPLTVNFLGSYQVSESVVNQISLNSYISTVVSLTFSVGVVFELPILIYFLTKIGIVTPDYLKKNRKYIFIVILIVAAIITPPDVFSQVMVAIPLTALFEVSIIVSKRVYKKNYVETK